MYMWCVPQSVYSKCFHKFVRFRGSQQISTNNSGIRKEYIQTTFFHDRLLTYSLNGRFVGGISLNGRNFSTRVSRFQFCLFDGEERVLEIAAQGRHSIEAYLEVRERFSIVIDHINMFRS